MEYDYIEQGDCLDLMEDIPDKSIDMILCDLPYGTTQNKWDKIIDLEELWSGYKRVIKDNGAIVLFSQQPFCAELIAANRSMFRYEWIWEKSKATGHLNSKRMPLKKHENILVFYKKLPTYNPQGVRKLEYPEYRKGLTASGKSRNGSNYGDSAKSSMKEYENYPTDIIFFPSINGNHPTEKPVNLLEYLIKTYTNEGEIVLDTCFGSGSTLVAAVNTGRHYIGFEIEEKYFNLASRRLDEVENNVFNI